MKKSVVLLMIFLTINLFGQVNSEISNTQKKSVETDSGKEDIYYIQRGDRLTIEVMEHPEFSKRVQVLPDGTIEYPILGKIKTEGMTVNILKSVIKSNLLPYVPSPIVSIYVSEIYGEKINIIGYINSPGNYQIYKPIGIVDAIAKAGGIVNMRRVKYVKIIRKNGSVINIKISKLWDSDNEKYSPERKLMLRTGDSLIIPTPIDFNWSVVSAIVSVINVSLTLYTFMQ